MRWFRDLSTGGKLHVAFALVVAVLAAVSALAYWSTATLHSSHEALYELEFQDVLDIKEIRANQLANRSDLLAMMTSESAPHLQAAEERVRARVEANEHRIRRLLLRNQRDADSLAQLQRFESLRQQGLQVRETQILPLIRAFEFARAKALHLSTQANRDAEMDAIADAFVHRTERDAQAALGRARERARDSQRLYVIAALLAVALAALITAALRRMLSDPLRDLAAAVQKVREGDLEVRIPAQARADEAGVLTEGFNRMVDALREKTRALSTETQLLNNVMNSIPDAIFIKDREQRFVRLNRAHAGILGITRPEEAIGKATADFFPADEARQRDEEDRQVMLTGQALPDKVRRISLPGGAFRWSSTTKAPVRNEIGEVIGIVGVARDITRRQIAQEKIRRLNRVYAVLSGINGVIIRVRDREELYREACRIAVEDGGFRFAWIGVVDADQVQLKPVAWTGQEQDFLAAVSSRLSLKDEPTGRDEPTVRALVVTAAMARKPLISNDVANDPRILFKQEHAERGIRSLAAFPLFESGKLTGVFALHAEEVDFFDDEEVRLLSEMAEDISFALEHIDKTERLERLNRIYAILSSINAAIIRVTDRDELFREACRIAVAAGLRMAWIGTYDAESETIKPAACSGHEDGFLSLMALSMGAPVREGRGLVRRAVREKCPVVLNDIEHDQQFRLREQSLERGYRSAAAIPLVVADELKGVFGLFAPTPHFFDASEMKLLVELAANLSFALDHLAKSERANYLAYYDDLTGLGNRALFDERLAQIIEHAQRSGQSIALCLVDIERFKFINDSLGREAGDALLKAIAERLVSAAGNPTHVARVGGDQFAVIATGFQHEEELGRLIEKGRQRVEAAPYVLGGTEQRIAVKAGIALFPNDAPNAMTLFRNAEAALKKAKTSGERALFYTQQMTARVAETLALENELRQAILREEFVLHYQPKVELQDRKIVGLEALIRWQSPKRGLVPPGEFIPLLEETGLILDVGSWALKRASLDHRHWTEAGLRPPRIAVNVSAIQLRQRDFVEVVERAVMEGLAPVGIDLEITESLIMHDLTATLDKLNEVRRLGINIAIDDFGTGYSSLGYLAKLPLHSLKIDRSFIVGMTKDPNAMSLVQTIISLAHSLRLIVIAEGVDSEEQAGFLKLLRCDEMQGYLISKPLPAPAIQGLIGADAAAPVQETASARLDSHG